MGATQLEFGGVPGATAMLAGLPTTVYALNLLCNKVNGEEDKKGKFFMLQRR